MSGTGGCLVVILDINVLLLSGDHSKQGVRYNSLLAQILAFLNAYVMLQEHNELVVFAVTSTGCNLLYNALADGRNVAGSAAPTQVVHSQLQQVLADAATSGQHGDAALAGALSRALCWVAGRVNKHAGPRPGSSKPLILCLIASDDVPRQYVPIMNAIFAAQRNEVIIDACILGANDSALLQQAAHLTGGTYFKPSDLSSTLQHLLQSFAVDTACRQWLQPPALLGVDFRAACFCHKRPCDVVYVCSVCMSIFCEQVADCSTCGTLFKRAAPKGGGLPA